MNNVEINKQAKLSQHFTLGELCKTSVKTKDGNIPSHVAIENLKRLTGWLESEQGGGWCSDVEPLDGVCRRHPRAGYGTVAALCSHPAGHQRRVARGLRRVADRAQRQGHLLAALCRKARGQQAENKADCLLIAKKYYYDNLREASSRKKINSNRVKPHSDEPP